MVLVGSVQWALGVFLEITPKSECPEILNSTQESDWESHQYMLLTQTKCLAPTLLALVWSLKCLQPPIQEVYGEEVIWKVKVVLTN